MRDIPIAILFSENGTLCEEVDKEISKLKAKKYKSLNKKNNNKLLDAYLMPNIRLQKKAFKRHPWTSVDDTHNWDNHTLVINMLTQLLLNYTYYDVVLFNIFLYKL